VDWLGVVVVDWLGVVVVLWLGVVVVVCEGVTPVAPGVPVVADGVVWVAEGLPVVAAPPGAVVVELTPGCVPDVPAVPVAVPVPPVLPVVCAAATPMARAITHEASKVFCMKMLLGAASSAAVLQTNTTFLLKWDAES